MYHIIRYILQVAGKLNDDDDEEEGTGLDVGTSPVIKILRKIRSENEIHGESSRQ